MISLRIELVWSCCPRDSQESSPAPQFDSISSSALCFRYCSALTSVHDYWKNHRLWLCGPLLAKRCLWFLTHCHSFAGRKQQSSNFMTAVTIRSDGDYRAQEEKMCHCFPLSPFYLPWSVPWSGCHDLSCFFFNLSFLILSSKLTFSQSSFTLIKKLFSSSLLSAIRVVSSFVSY